MPPRRLLHFTALALLVFTPLAARAWNPTGHMISASMAYDAMPAEARASVIALLESHPDIVKWRQTMPKDVPGLDVGRYLFMRASTWPDDIRKSGSPYDHPVWHYVDYPAVAPDFPVEPAPTNTEDILSALALCQKKLADHALPATERAAHLAWLFHLVGDIQQPLHCVALINTTSYPRPDGDRGGNLFFVSLAGVPVNLHFLWDNLPGSLLDSRELIERATQLQSRFPRASLPEMTNAKDPLAWSLEGRAAAIEHVYRRGALAGAREATGVVPPLPADYTTASRAVAERRLALAGYRLADELAKLKE